MNLCTVLHHTRMAGTHFLTWPDRPVRIYTVWSNLAEIGFPQIFDSNWNFGKTWQVITTVWVDDVVVASSDELVLESVKNMLTTRFKMKDLGKRKHYLSLDFNPSGECVTMSHEKAKHCKPLMEKSWKGSTCWSVNLDPLSKVIKYGEVVNSLVALTVCTRPDLSFIEIKLSQ